MSKHYRPVLRPPRTQLEKVLEALIALGIIVVLAMTLWGYFTLPAIFPTHYGSSGVPNAYGGKENLLIAPIISICMTALLMFMTRFPYRYNYAWRITPENASRQYSLARLLLHWIAFEVVWMFCGLQWIVILSAQGPLRGLILLFIPATVLALFVTIIIYIFIAVRAR